MKGMTAPMKNITWCNLPNKSKLHIVQLHVVQKYMDGAYILFTGHRSRVILVKNQKNQKYKYISYSGDHHFFPQFHCWLM